jgi:hypothetical protein
MGLAMTHWNVLSADLAEMEIPAQILGVGVKLPSY